MIHKIKLRPIGHQPQQQKKLLICNSKHLNKKIKNIQGKKLEKKNGLDKWHKVRLREMHKRPQSNHMQPHRPTAYDDQAKR